MGSIDYRHEIRSIGSLPISSTGRANSSDGHGSNCFPKRFTSTAVEWLIQAIVHSLSLNDQQYEFVIMYIKMIGIENDIVKYRNERSAERSCYNSTVSVSYNRSLTNPSENSLPSERRISRPELDYIRYTSPHGGYMDHSMTRSRRQSDY